MSESLKDEILSLLERDRGFRYAVAGLIGLDEILKRLDRHEEELVRLREDMMLGFKRHDEELAKLREETNRLREDMMLGFKRYDEELVKLREDMREGFSLLRRHIDALGARWGLLAEGAFREGMKGVVEKHFGGRVERWTYLDSDGFVFGYPSTIDIDLVIRDDIHILVEVKSSVSRADVYELWKIGQLYERLKTVKPKLAIVSPYIDEDAKKIAEQLKIETYTD